MKFSPNQLKAINTRNKNILVSAAAGSGKTAVLVQRVAEIISSPNTNITDLLIVTFTKAAAAEMLLRIEKAIENRLSDPNTSNKAHLYKQLRLINRAEVTTIDSFCARLVRKYFYNTPLEPDFVPASEDELAEIRQKAMNKIIENAFKQYEAGSPTYAPLYNLCDMLSGGSSNKLELEEEILTIYKMLSSMPYPQKWLEQTFKALNTQTYEEYLTSDFIQSILHGLDLNTALSLINEADEIMENIFSKTTLKEEAAAIKALAEEQDICALSAHLNKITFPRFNASKKVDLAAYNRAKILRDTAKSIIISAKASVEYFSEKSFNTYKNALPMLKLVYTLAGDFTGEYMRQKSAANMYEFSDIERACLNMLVQNGSSTPLAQQLKNKYAEVITDEYQDTNSLQEEILKALSRDNNRFMVGDIKQSIYGFRNADPSIFTNRYNSIAENKASKNDMLVCLSENYRSRKSVLNFVNLIFSQIMSKNLGGVPYEELNFPQNPKYDQKDDVKTEVLILNRSANLKPPYRPNNEDLLIKLCQNSSAAEALLIANKIKELTAENPNLKYSDFVILMRVLSGKAESIINTLNLCGIPAITDKAADSTDFIENKTIISYLKVIDNPCSDIDLAAVLHSPIYRLTTEDMAEIRLYGLGLNLPFYDCIVKYAKDNNNKISQKINLFLQDSDYFSSRFQTEPVNSVLSEIYAKTDYYNYLNILSESKNRRANLDKLLDIAANYDATSESGLYGFLNYLSNIKFEQAQIVTPQNNAVRIMTIHNSKGLQFPIVFLSGIKGKFIKADLGDKIVANKNTGICLAAYDSSKGIISQTAPLAAARLNHNKALAAEAMRLYYVAVTRAEQRLIITASDTAVSKNITTYNDICKKLVSSYSQSSIPNMREIPAFIITSASSFFKILTTALYNREDSPLYSLKIKHWFEMADAIENTTLSPYAKEISAGELVRVNYKYNNIAGLPTNVSVTEIKKEANADVYPLDYTNKNFRFVKPRFISAESKKLTPMETGTAYHALFSAIDYKNPPDSSQELKARCLKTGIITEEESSVIDDALVDAYLSSPLRKRASSAVNVFKEHSFTMGLSPTEVFPNLPADPLLNNEVILTHGIIDLFFEEEDGIVIVDFKTDKSTDYNALTVAYTPQLNVYKLAVEQAEQKKVKQMLLYLVNGKKTLLINKL